MQLRNTRVAYRLVLMAGAVWAVAVIAMRAALGAQAGTAEPPAGQPPPLVANDLSKIDRLIAKEPTYETRVPKYCLVAFGSNAATRVWLVHDGDVLYADLNSDGNLTDPAERVEKNKEGQPGSRSFVARTKPLEIAGKRHPVELAVFEHGTDGDYALLILHEDPRAPRTGWGGKESSSRLRFAGDAKAAPVLNFFGPRTMAVVCIDVQNRAAVLERGRDCEVHIIVGTAGLGRGSFASEGLQFRVPKDIHPVGEFEFPARKKGQPPLKAPVVFDRRC